MKSTTPAVRSSLGRLIIAATMLVVAELFPQLATATPFCERNWQYAVPDLQEARRRLSSSAIQTFHGRVNCAETIIKSPGLAGPFKACNECAREYAGLLADGAIFMRRASVDEAPDEGARKAYVEKEVAVRERLHEFLGEEKQAAIRDDYFNGNLLALADAMERAGMANRYHQMVSALSETSQLNLQVYRVWIKAVRSCAVWDFKSVDNSATLRSTLCNAECLEDLKAVYAGLKAANLVLADGTVRKSMPTMPIPAECEPPPP